MNQAPALKRAVAVAAEEEVVVALWSSDVPEVLPRQEDNKLAE
jgi:hypothetical protein